MLEERGIYPGERTDDLNQKENYQYAKDGQWFKEFDDDENAEDEDDTSSDDSEDIGEDTESIGRRAEEVTNTEIQNAIADALSKCPNCSCTLRSMTARVLREMGVRTRGNPRKMFERRVMHSLNDLEEHGIIERYKAKNKRVRLVNKKA